MLLVDDIDLLKKLKSDLEILTTQVLSKEVLRVNFYRNLFTFNLDKKGEEI